MNRYVLLTGIVVMGFLAVGMFQAKSGAGESNDRIRALNAEIAQLESEIELLEAEMDTLTGRARIAELASSRLGMGPARSRQMIDIETADAYFGPLTDWESEE
jgi:cell division protein FtsL